MRHVSVDTLAPAKINLTLHIVGRRSDGYHLLDSLVVFADVGDRVTVRPAGAAALTVSGPFAADAPAGRGNLVQRALELSGAAVEASLWKELPVGAGIGGGSSDAAATLRAVAAITGRPPPDGLALGADVPVCMNAQPARMRGIGERLSPLTLPRLALVLVHPGASVSTAAAFAGLERAEGAPMPDAPTEWGGARDVASWLALQRNDLEAAALRLAPGIAEARSALEAEASCLVARMSGSGSCVFGIFSGRGEAAAAALRLGRARPDWWVRAADTLSEAPELQERRLTT